MACARKTLHGVKYFGLLAQLSAHFFQRTFSRSQGHTQGFRLGRIAHGDHDAVSGDTAGRQVPRQYQAPRLSHYLTAFKRRAYADHAMQLVQQLRVDQQVKHFAGIHPWMPHRPQPWHTPCCSVGSQQQQAAVLQAKLHERYRHRVHQRLQARLRQGLEEALPRRGEEVGQQFGRNHGLSGASESWG